MLPFRIRKNHHARGNRRGPEGWGHSCAYLRGRSELKKKTQWPRESATASPSAGLLRPSLRPSPVPLMPRGGPWTREPQEQQELPGEGPCGQQVALLPGGRGQGGRTTLICHLEVSTPGVPLALRHQAEPDPTARALELRTLPRGGLCLSDRQV